MELIYGLNSESDTKQFAQVLASLFKGKVLFGLGGELGAGKTTLVRYFIEAKGGSPYIVTSPTFTLINEYKVGGEYIYHIDLYRLSTGEDLYNIGLEEYLEFRDGICFVEWFNKFEWFFENLDMVEILIYIKKEEAREVKVKNRGELYENLLKKLHLLYKPTVFCY